ncbi:MAG: hypothetical protein Q4B71_03865 [Cardiobacteriaceae bacterium]|nr:hypothetical protein [Cardiobacteriaceae bacterium]
MWNALIRKEWRLLATPSYFLTISLVWLLLGWYFAAGLQEYQAIATKLAQLENQRGASDMILGSAQQILQLLMLAWSLYFGAKIVAQERQWQTHTLLRGVQGSDTLWLCSKALWLMFSLCLLTLPFWAFVAYLSLANAVVWDTGLLISQALAQLLLILYATGIALTFSSSQNQTLSASLGLALIYLLLWLAPLFIQSPLWLTESLKFLSPFEHLALLNRGILSFATLNFLLLHLAIFITLTPIHWRQR